MIFSFIHLASINCDPELRSQKHRLLPSRSHSLSSETDQQTEMPCSYRTGARQRCFKLHVGNNKLQLRVENLKPWMGFFPRWRLEGGMIPAISFLDLIAEITSIFTYKMDITVVSTSQGYVRSKGANICVVV